MAEPRTSWMSLPIGPRGVHRVVTDHRWICDNWIWNCVLFDERIKKAFFKKMSKNLWLLFWWLFETPSQGLGRQAFYRAFQIRQNRKQHQMGEWDLKKETILRLNGSKSVMTPVLATCSTVFILPTYFIFSQVYFWKSSFYCVFLLEIPREIAWTAFSHRNRPLDLFDLTWDSPFGR